MAISLSELIDNASVIPILTLADINVAAPLAEALSAGGMRVIEMTLRTPSALEVMRAMQAAEPDLIVGMGTIRTAEDVKASLEAGAHFLVSPGLTPQITGPLQQAGVPVLPGVATISEALAAQELGFELLKFFPANQSGGPGFLKAIHGPCPDLRFCPTGSITREKAPDYLALPNVVCCGGSWIANAAMIKAGEWDQITENAKAAQAMKI